MSGFVPQPPIRLHVAHSNYFTLHPLTYLQSFTNCPLFPKLQINTTTSIVWGRPWQMWIEDTRETITKVPENRGVILQNFVPRLSVSVPTCTPPPLFRLQIKDKCKTSIHPQSSQIPVEQYAVQKWQMLIIRTMQVHAVNVGRERRNYQRILYSLFQYLFRSASLVILYYDQQMHNYFTNYHTATCFDTIVSSSDSL